MNYFKLPKLMLEQCRQPKSRGKWSRYSSCRKIGGGTLAVSYKNPIKIRDISQGLSAHISSSCSLQRKTPATNSIINRPLPFCYLYLCTCRISLFKGDMFPPIH